MNDIAGTPLSITDRVSLRTRTEPMLRLRPHGFSDGQGSAREDPGAPLTRRRRDRLASAASLGLLLASPRSALLVATLLRPRFLRPTSTSMGRAPATNRRHGIGS